MAVRRQIVNVQFYAVQVCRALTGSTLEPARVDVIWLRTAVFAGLQEPTIDKHAVTEGGSEKLSNRSHVCRARIWIPWTVDEWGVADNIVSPSSF